MRLTRQLAGMALLFVAYATTARLGLSFDAAEGVATAVWPPTGISLAALVLFGTRLWPGITVAAFIVNAQTGVPLLAAAGMALGNTLEAVAGAWLLRRVGFDARLRRVRDVMALVGLAALVSTAISATFGATSLWLTGVLPLSGYAELWRVWWVGDVGGDLVVAPVLFLWLTGGPPRLSRVQVVELLGLALAVVGAGLMAFLGGYRAYVVYPALLWAGLRFGPRGAASATFAVAALAVVQTYLGRGPFGGPSVREGLVELQIFIAVTATTTLVVGAAAAERRLATLLRDEFLSVASHELRTPLAALRLRIDGVSRVLGKTVADERVVTRMGALGGQLDRLEKLVDELLDVSRITAGRLHLEVALTQLAGVVKEVVGRFPGVDITVDLDEESAGVWDPVRIEQVVSNLIGNAVKHGAPPIRVKARREGAKVRLTVTDHGPGVPPGDERRIFDRFEQRSRAGGLGLGLYITRQIVQAHGGTITVEGATFTVVLPGAPQKA